MADVWEAPAAVPSALSDDDLGRLSLTLPQLRIDPHEGGLRQAGKLPTGALLVSMDVFDRLPDPWFEAGGIRGAADSHDIWFCLKAQRAGARLWCDLSLPVAHITSVMIWPEIGGGGCGHRFEFLRTAEWMKVQT